MISPDDRADRIEYKTQTYLEKGARRVWLVHPRAETVHVCVAGGSRVYGKQDTIDASALFQGMPPVSVQAIFALPEWLARQSPAGADQPG